jgi:hypothetical protein
MNSWAWQTPTIPALKWKEASLGYIVRYCLKKQKQNETNLGGRDQEAVIGQVWQKVHKTYVQAGLGINVKPYSNNT